MIASRGTWASLNDPQLLGQCAVDTYRASGPGGQKRNKTSSAVRLRHLPSGLMVIAEESRSQHENRLRALRRLRQALYLQLREELPADALAPEVLARRAGWRDARNRAGRLDLSRKDPRFWPAVGVALDVLQAVEARVSDAAEALGVSTANLVDFLRSDPKVWQQANALRARFGRKPLLS
jgi:RF-1 domain